jgi:8-oxo-dGDP phosphatase
MRRMETLGSAPVYESPFLTVREDAVRRDDGSEGVHVVVDAADIALVVAVEGDRVRLVEQYRHPVGGRRWEFPSGSHDARLDADPVALARRELREETGLEAGRLTELGILEVTPSTMSQRCHVFLATELEEGPPQREPGEHDMESAWFPRAELERVVADGRLTDATSVAAYALLLLHLGPEAE